MATTNAPAYRAVMSSVCLSWRCPICRKELKSGRVTNAAAFEAFVVRTDRHELACLTQRKKAERADRGGE